MRRRATLARLDGGIVGRAGPVTLRFGETGGADIEVAFALRRRGGTAVVRNRCRRRLRAWLASRARDGQLAPGVYLVAVREGAFELEYEELTTWADKALAQLMSRRAHPR